MKTCGQCKHFIGGGDWNLCCGIEHPTPKEKEQGLKFLFGYLCYADTMACDMFESKEELIMKKKYIDAEGLLQEDFTDFWHDKADQKVFENILIEAPDADVIEVIRCKDCKYSRERNEHEQHYLCEGVLICTSGEATDECWNPVYPSHFCSYGERKE